MNFEKNLKQPPGGIDFLLTIGDNSYFPQKIEISTFQGLINLFRFNSRNIAQKKIYLMTLLLKYSFHSIEKSNSSFCIFSILDGDCFYFLKKKKNPIFFNLGKNLNSGKNSQLAFFLNQAFSSNMISISIIFYLICDLILTIEKPERPWVFKVRIVETCLWILLISFRYFFDQTVLEHSLTILKSEIDYSIDLNGFQIVYSDAPGGGRFFLDKLSTLYRNVKQRLEVNRNHLKEMDIGDVPYFSKIFRFKFLKTRGHKIIQIFKGSNNGFFLNLAPISKKGRKYLPQTNRLGVEKICLNFHFEFLVTDINSPRCWVISKIIDLFWFQNFKKFPHSINHILISNFFYLFIKYEKYEKVQNFFLSTHLVLLNIGDFSGCLENIFKKIYENSKELNPMVRDCFSTLISLHYTNISFKINWKKLNWCFVSFQSVYFFSQFFQKTIWLNLPEIVNLTAPFFLFFLGTSDTGRLKINPRRMEFLRNFLVKKKEIYELKEIIQKFVPELFKTRFRLNFPIYLFSILFSTWPISFKLILIERYFPSFLEFSKTEAIRFIGLKSLLDISSSLVTSKAFVLFEKIISYSLLNINQLGRNILEKKFYSKLTTTTLIHDLIFFTKKISATKNSINQDKKKFTKYIKECGMESKQFVIKAYLNARKTVKIWEKQMTNFRSCILESILLYLNKFYEVFNSKVFFLWRNKLFKLELFFFYSLISFWDSSFKSRKSFFQFKVRTRKTHKLFPKEKNSFPGIYTFLVNFFPNKFFF